MGRARAVLSPPGKGCAGECPRLLATGVCQEGWCWEGLHRLLDPGDLAPQRFRRTGWQHQALSQLIRPREGVCHRPGKWQAARPPSSALHLQGAASVRPTWPPRPATWHGVPLPLPLLAISDLILFTITCSFNSLVFQCQATCWAWGRRTLLPGRGKAFRDKGHPSRSNRLSPLLSV